MDDAFEMNWHRSTGDLLLLTHDGDETPTGKNVFRCEDVSKLPSASKQYDHIFWRDPTHFQGKPGKMLRELARLLKPTGTFQLQTRIIPATKLRGRKGKEVKFAGEYLNAFHRFYEPGTVAAHSQYAWRKWLGEAGFAIEDVQIRDVLTDLRLHPKHSEKDFIRLKVLLIHAPEVAKQRLTAHVSLDRIQFHVYQANFVCRLENYE